MSKIVLILQILKTDLSENRLFIIEVGDIICTKVDHYSHKHKVILNINSS